MKKYIFSLILLTALSLQAVLDPQTTSDNQEVRPRPDLQEVRPTEGFIEVFDYPLGFTLITKENDHLTENPILFVLIGDEIYEINFYASYLYLALLILTLLLLIIYLKKRKTNYRTSGST